MKMGLKNCGASITRRRSIRRGRICRMMRSEMPQRFWNNMPELANLGKILVKAPERVAQMIAVQKKTQGAGPFVPAYAVLRQLREAVKGCEGCELYKHATHRLFGEGADATPASF